MAKRKKQQEFDDVEIDVVEATGDSRSFLEQNGKSLFSIIGVLALLIGGYFAYKTLVKDPKQQKAVGAMYQAQFQFDQDSFKLALTNPGEGQLGFVDIVDQYAGTPAGNLANYYAGVSYLNLGDFEAAASYLKAFSPSDKDLAAMKNGLLGDISSEKDDLNGALSMYKKAASIDNDVITPYYLKKLGLLQTKLGKGDEAISTFQLIKSKYPNSPEGRDIDKFL